MNETKFRAWDQGMQEMYSGIEIEEKSYLDGYLTNGQVRIVRYDDGEAIELLPLQYIGKKDADGTEIYAGDVLVLDMLGGPEKFQVSYSSETAKFEFKDRDGVCWGIGESNVIHVIGNIYTNPGLMEEEAR